MVQGNRLEHEAIHFPPHVMLPNFYSPLTNGNTALFRSQRQKRDTRAEIVEKLTRMSGASLHENCHVRTTCST